MLTQERLKEIVEYNQKSGIFRWKINNGKRAIKDNIAGTFDANGYCIVTIDNVRYKAHRLAFLYINGIFPKNDIDHINHDRADNRWENLREVSKSNNLRNRKVNHNSKSGYHGVTKYRNEKWLATIHLRLGIFDTKEEAIDARKQAELLHNFHINHGKNSQIERENSINGNTYKIKSPNREEAIYITINNSEINGTIRPVEFFINSKNIGDFQWINCITKLLSSVFRNSHMFPSYAIDELIDTFDPRGGYIIPGTNLKVNSIVAHIGIIIKLHCKNLGLI